MKFNELKIRIGIIAVMTLLSFCSYSQTSTNQRYNALMLLNLSNDGAPERELIHMASNYGMNALYVTIPWDFVYYGTPEEGANWARYDEQIKLATDLGLSVAIRIHVSRNKHRLKGYWDWEKDGLKDHTNISQMGGYSATTFRYNHEPAVEKAANFVQEVANRYKWVHQANKLIFVSVTNTPEQEAGYPYENFEPDTDHPKIYKAIFDCSDQSIQEFRVWLKKNYGKIDRLNHIWGTQFASFDDAHPMLTFWDPLATFQFRAGKDWYLFRHEILKKYTNRLITAVKSVDPTIRYVSDYGAVTDGISALRGTVLFGDLNERADGVKVNDLLDFDNRFTMDVIRGGMPAGKFLANEVFVDDRVNMPEALKQANENFEYGANLVAYVISTTSSMRRFQSVMQQIIAKWQHVPIVLKPQPNTIFYSNLSAVEKGIMEDTYSVWKNFALKDPTNPTSVYMKPNLEFYDESYWEVARNIAPFVRVPLPMKILEVGQNFSFEVSMNSFGDHDGHVDKLEIAEKPNWLQLSGTTLSGTPSNIGEWSVPIVVIDDEGGRTTTYQIVRVVNAADMNRPPELRLTLGELSLLKDQNFSYSLPNGLFVDPDGAIERIEILNLPSWATFSNGVISGRAVNEGEQRVLIRAYDNRNAFVESYLKIVVALPQPENLSPIVINPIPIQYAPELEPYNFIIPAETFQDRDGYISSVVIREQPTWLTMSFNRLYGTPPSDGEYSFLIRAYDNKGAFVDMPFILRIEKPFVTFNLQEAGNLVEPNIIGKIENGSFFEIDSLPNLLNISASSNYEFERLELSMIEPMSTTTRIRYAPYTFFAKNNGFVPQVGKVKLIGKAYTWDNQLLFTTSVDFTIGRYRDELASKVDSWTAFPNPFNETVGVKIDQPISIANYDFSIVSITGKRIVIPKESLYINNDFIQFNFTRLGLSSGIYFISVESDGEIIRRFKVLKY